MTPDDRSAFERWANIIGRTPAEVAAVDRYLTACGEYAVARHRFDITAHQAAGAMRNFTDAWRASMERLAVAEAQQIAEHPDLTEVNVYLDGFYGEGEEA